MLAESEPSSMSVSEIAAQVKHSVDIVDVIGQVVQLRRVGSRHVGLCPFHQEKTASFHVDSRNQFFHCFGCGAGGDVLTFVMRYQNLPFGDALKHLADRYGIPLPRQDQSTRDAHDDRNRLYHILKSVADFFYDQLHHSQEGKEAREYLQMRALPESVIEAQRLGYAPNRWDGLLQHLKKSGIDPDLGVTAGVLIKHTDGRYYDRFRRRLIFPIADDRERIAAFGGRSLDGSEPKYLNSPETPVHHKGRMLYQMATAREACRRVRQVVLVEGYMDLLAFHARGFHRVAATLGTALTPHQVRLLARIADEVILLYDADPAGQRAMARAAPLFFKEQLAVSCLQLPRGMDPDDFLKAKGIEEFDRLVQQRKDLAAHVIGQMLDSWDGTSGGKARVLAEIEPVYLSMVQPVLKSECLRLVADRLSISEKAIEEQLQGKYRAPNRRFASTGVNPAGFAPTPRGQSARSPEEIILFLMVRYPELIGDVGASGAVGHFEPEPLRIIAETLLRSPHPPRGAFEATAVYESLPSRELKELFTRILMEWDSFGDINSARLHLKDRLGVVLEREEKKKPPSLREALRKAEQQGDKDQVRLLLEQIQGLSSAKKKTKDRPENA